MKWNKFRLKTTTEAEDIVSSMLMDLGVQGIEIEDKIPMTQAEKEQMFVDILPEIEADDGVAYLSFYLEEDEDKEKVLANVKKELEEMSAYVNVGACEIEESQTEDVDWVNNWKKYFHQFYVDDILIIPSWEEVKPEDSDKMVIHIDPGTAFGTGMHETTQLCIRQIRKHVTPETKILDVGCGAGFFSILLAKLGHEVTGIDLTPDMIIHSRELAKEENASCTFEVMDAENPDFPDGTFDVIVSRNLTWTLPDAARAYKEWIRVLKTGGILINADANYGADDFSDTADLPANHAHFTVGDAMMQECEEIKRQLPISSYVRPAWDLETLGKLGINRFSIDLGISSRIYTKKDEFYNPTPMFLICGEKNKCNN